MTIDSITTAAIEVGDNLTTIIMGALTLLTAIVTGFYAMKAANRAQVAITRADAVAATLVDVAKKVDIVQDVTNKVDTVQAANVLALAEVAKKVDGLTSERIQQQKDLGIANAEIERGKGRDEQRKEGEQTAALVAAQTETDKAVAAAATPSAPVPAKVVNTVTDPANVTDANPKKQD